MSVLKFFNFLTTSWICNYLSLYNLVSENNSCLFLQNNKWVYVNEFKTIISNNTEVGQWLIVGSEQLDTYWKYGELKNQVCQFQTIIKIPVWSERPVIRLRSKVFIAKHHLTEQSVQRTFGEIILWIHPFLSESILHQTTNK